MNIPDPLGALFGMRVEVNPNVPDGQIFVFATCERCSHPTAVHLEGVGCTMCPRFDPPEGDGPSLPWCLLERPKDGIPAIVIKDVEALRGAR